MQNLQTVLDRYRVIAIFLVLVAIFSIVFISICYTGRLVLRQQANDPQVEVTEQVAGIIRQGAPLDAIVGAAQQIELNDSDALFVAIFDQDKNLAGSTALVNGQSISVPAESFDLAKAQGDYRFDLEVSEGRKMAAVIRPVDDTAYVLAGRSLAEFEKRADTLSLPIWIGWGISVLLALVLSPLLKPLRPIAIVEETNVTVVEESSAQ